MTIEIGPNLASCAWQLCVFGGVAAAAAGIVLVHLVEEAERIIHALGDLLRGWRGMDKASAKIPWVAVPVPPERRGPEGKEEWDR